MNGMRNGMQRRRGNYYYKVDRKIMEKVGYTNPSSSNKFHGAVRQVITKILFRITEKFATSLQVHILIVLPHVKQRVLLLFVDSVH